MIDTSAWKEFHIGDLFSSEQNGELKSVQQLTEGDVAVVSSSMQEQGIIGYYVTNAPYENQLTIAHIGAGAGFCSYHDYKFNITCNAGVLTCKYGLNKYTGNYLASVITRHCMQRYDYKNVVTESKLFAEIIKLPATSDGQPDWDYMKSYMKTVMEESEKSLEGLKKADDTKHLIDVSGWGEFRIGDVFDVVKGSRLTKADMRDGVIKFIGSSAINNGETHRIANDEKIHPANTITVCYNGSVGETFYQDERFWASDDVNVLYPKFDMTKEMAMFVCPIIKSAGQKYAFVDKWKQEDMKNEVIKLPINTNGEPDWQYMEDYMRKQFKEAESAISKLQLVV